MHALVRWPGLLVPLAFSLLVSACATGGGRNWHHSEWVAVHERTGTSLRGLCVVDSNIVWASGSGGTILRSLDGGRSFQDVAPAGSTDCDFRDVHAFSADTAVAMVAGQPARVYRTTDGGASWTIVHEDADERAFFDSIAFDGPRGFLFGDPLDGAFYVLVSEDAGVTWQRQGALPEPAGEEAGFAASGTCISLDGRAVRIATGGGASRCLTSFDGGASWQAAAIPVLQGAPSQGTFGLAFRGHRGVAIGGDYRVPERVDGTAAWTSDGGRSWRESAAGAGGYRSAAAWLDDDSVLAVGPDGASLSRDGGATWEPFGRLGFHAVACGNDGSVFACGSDGRIAALGKRPAREFGVTSLFGDHMVLPADSTVTIRGHGEPGAEVAVRASWREHLATTIDGAGRWRAELETPTAGGPHTVVLQCEAVEIILRDVLVGSVWLCSGQSNMEMPIGSEGGWKGGVDNWEREVAAADHPTLRVFTVAKKTSGLPLDSVEGEWRVCTPEHAAEFSATAYFFGRELVQRELGPIGLVVSSWGGTLCEAWTSGSALAAFPEFEQALAATKRPTVAVASQRAAFWDAVPTAPAADEWQEVVLPGLWSKDGLGSFDGVAFYRRRVELPPKLRGQAMRLELGAIDDMDTVWCNRVRVGGMEDNGAWATKRSYAVPAGASEGRAELEILVRVVDTGGEGGFSGLEQDMRLHSAEGDTIAMAGNWSRQLGPKLGDLPPWPRSTRNSPNRPAVLWNGMIAPLLPFPFTGVIWYQGESNRSRAEQYSRLFPAMIRDWRRAIGGMGGVDNPVPFHFVQIAPFRYSDEDGATAELREAQAAALALPATGMVVTLDIGDPRDIHPRNKQDVGRRLALQAQRHPYGSSVVADGPTLLAVERDGAALRLAFRSVDGGLVADTPVRGFELASADGVFQVAQARIDGDTVVVSHPSIPAPTTVRYAWAAVPDGTLRNGLGLPAAPFRSQVSSDGR